MRSLTITRRIVIADSTRTPSVDQIQPLEILTVYNLQSRTEQPSGRTHCLVAGFTCICRLSPSYNFKCRVVPGRLLSGCQSIMPLRAPSRSNRLVLKNHSLRDVIGYFLDKSPDFYSIDDGQLVQFMIHSSFARSCVCAPRVDERQHLPFKNHGRVGPRRP